MPLVLPIHVAAGGVAMVLGAVALVARKGGTVHRRSGLLFVCAMIVLGVTAAILGLRNGTTGNVFGGVTTVYFVVTALLPCAPSRAGLGASSPPGSSPRPSSRSSTSPLA